ncbi:DUF2931 family protein [Pseudomonas sp. PB106]|uniref:DUF2931 family protein n=1 Tax=Pseudomonas sp. PB106 TaxID=2494699 RepID=UPI00131A87EB|nr:DUF2931 family protein [Pseudomonas sp. PB106]KAE9643473.1 DUF2931 family protein [Pseudomonas sp. PB106]
MLEKNNNYKLICLLIFAFVLNGCTTRPTQSLPYDAWGVRIYAPDYMEIQIEAVVAVDMDDRVFANIGSGVAGQRYPNFFIAGVSEKLEGQPAGWPKNPAGRGRRTLGAKLPKAIYVRWQSLVEPQTYHVVIPIPDSTRALMLEKEETRCWPGSTVKTQYRKWLTVGLAPGGIAKVWARSSCLSAIEVLRVQGVIHPKGPMDGQAGFKYRKLHEESRAYIERFGIPYGSW